jgi:hypothetical protein
VTRTNDTRAVARKGRPIRLASSRLGQHHWLEEHHRQSHTSRASGIIGPTHWQRTRRLIETVRPNKRHRVRAPLDAAHLYTKRNGTSRRGKPWPLLRV